jgi:hypothetical protein
MTRARRSAAFYNTLAILPVLVSLAFIRYFFPNATGTLWDVLVYLVVAWAFVVAVLVLLQVLRSRKP